MKLRALDQVHISSVRPDSIGPGEEFHVSNATGEDLLRKYPEKFEKADGQKAEPAPKNKAEPKPDNKASQPSYEEMTVADLKKLADERGVDLGDATKKGDIIAALELSDEQGGSKAE